MELRSMPSVDRRLTSRGVLSVRARTKTDVVSSSGATKEKKKTHPSRFWKLDLQTQTQNSLCRGRPCASAE